MEIKEKRITLVIELKKEEIEKLDTVKNYNDYVATEYNEGIKNDIITDYSIDSYDESEEALLRITTNVVNKEEDLYVHYIPLTQIFNKICGTKDIEFSVKGVCSDVDKKIISDALINNKFEETDTDEDEEYEMEEEINSWFLELEFSMKNYKKFVQSVLSNKAKNDKVEKISDK